MKYALNSANFWDRELSDLLPDDDNARDILVSFCCAVVYDEKWFKEFLEAVSNGDNFQLEESFGIYMPASLIQQNEYKGTVEITEDRFDGIDLEANIKLSVFTLFVERVVTFHLKHFNNDLDSEFYVNRLQEIENTLVFPSEL